MMERLVRAAMPSLLRSMPLYLLLLLCFGTAWLNPSRAEAQTAAGDTASAPAASLTDPKVQAALQEAKQLDTHHQFSFAANSYKKANKLAGGGCPECLRGEFNAQMADGNYKDAGSTAGLMEQIATTPMSKALAEYRHGEAVYATAGDKPKSDKLEAAHGLLQEALSNYPKLAPALFLDGKILAQLGKMDEAKEDFARCVSCVSPKDPARLRAEHFAENPELSLHKMAPPFEVTALDGSRFNLDGMGGRVVLIDFWATWCGPCNAELPHMRQIAKDFAGQPLVIISVSWDADEVRWKEFVAKNDMTWVQYRDADHKLGNLFGVQAIPHYFTIDSDGVLTAEMLGSGSDVEGKLKKLLVKAREAQKGNASPTVATEPRSAGN